MSDHPSKPTGPAFWLQTARAFAYPASLSAVLLGTALAMSQGYAFIWERFSRRLDRRAALSHSGQPVQRRL